MSGVEVHTTVGDIDVTEAYLRLPVAGNWMATCEMGTPTVPPEGSSATLAITRSDGTQDRFTGTVRRSQNLVDAQRVSTTIVGGAGKLLDVIPALHISAATTNIPAGNVLAKIVAATGAEALAAGVLASLNAFHVGQWTRVDGAAWAALENLAYVFDLGWRVLRDGTIWMGRDTWPAVDASAFYASGDPRDGMVLYAPDGAPFTAGTTIDGARVVECCYRIEPGKVRMEARMALPGDAVRVPPLAPYARSYVGTVVKQNADDLTLDINAQDPALGTTLRRVQYRVGFAGSKTEVPQGSIVRVSFENGLPYGAYAHDINMDLTAAKKFALEGDTSDAGFLSVTTGMTGVTAIVYTPPGGTPPVGPGVVTTAMSAKITGPCHHYAKGVPTPV